MMMIMMERSLNAHEKRVIYLQNGLRRI